MHCEWYIVIPFIHYSTVVSVSSDFYVLWIEWTNPCFCTGCSCGKSEPWEEKIFDCCLQSTWPFCNYWNWLDDRRRVREVLYFVESQKFFSKAKKNSVTQINKCWLQRTISRADVTSISLLLYRFVRLKLLLLINRRIAMCSILSW